MMQGDQYGVKIKGRGFSISDVSKVEFVICNLKKYYDPNSSPVGAVTYDSTTQTFSFPVTQSEMFALDPKVIYKNQVRVKFNSGDVIGTQLPDGVIIKSVSSEVL